jgi:DNA anti-recombination protein RmuC
MSKVSAEVQQIRADISAQQDEATAKVNELLKHLEERRVQTAKETEDLLGQAKASREEADAYAAEKRAQAEHESAAMLHKAEEQAQALVVERRTAAQEELEGLNGRIAKLQQREATITARVDELRSIFAKSFGAFSLDDDSSQDASRNSSRNEDSGKAGDQESEQGHEDGPDVPVVNKVPDQDNG